MRIAFFRLLAVAAVFGLLVGAPARTAEPYRDFAARLVAGLPGDAHFRPDLEAELAALANGYRASQGKPALIAAKDFVTAARAHAADMMLHDFMGHRSSTGLNFDSRMRSFVGDITRFPSMGENAARDSQKTPADAAKARKVMLQWIGSGQHRRNLVSLDYGFVSSGVVQRGSQIWAVQIFWAAPREKGIFQ